jgi:hypothetical protein
MTMIGCNIIQGNIQPSNKSFQLWVKFKSVFFKVVIEIFGAQDLCKAAACSMSVALNSSQTTQILNVLENHFFDNCTTKMAT